MKKINFIFTSVLISFVLTGALGFIPINNNAALALMVELKLEDLTKEADSILRGEVTDMRSEWNENKTRIYTYITISVKERIKGSSTGNTVTIRQLGGTVGRKSLFVSNSAIFQKGEEAIVFLKPETVERAARIHRVGTRGIMHKIVGKEQGKYHIAREAATRKGLVTLGRGTFATTTGEIVTKAGKQIALEEFIRQIKQVK